MHRLSFRRIHLDFHTSEKIKKIGESFDKTQFQSVLKNAAVDAVTLFATCHHGWSYYVCKVGRCHPHLKFDLLRAQYDACREVGIETPIYLTTGVNNMAATEHPEWRQLGPDGRLTGWSRSNLDAGFFRMYFNTGYLDFLCEQIEEVVTLFPDCDGIFLDITDQPECCCHTCISDMERCGLDPLVEEDRKAHSRNVMLKYYRRTTAAARIHRSDMPIFHNSGHIQQGDREILEYFSHLELESLPTGGWGYDHFPMSAKYCANLPHEMLGMTGKFHTSWGEFGGFKHPNALRYECNAMLAVGAKCCVGDQLHPYGIPDESTYEIIGSAYREVAEKESWCRNVKPVSDIAVMSSAAVNRGRIGNKRETAADIGAGRILLEGQFQFSIVDPEMPLDGYKFLLLPDDIHVDAALKTKIDTFLQNGGKLILSGTSGYDEEENTFHWDIGSESFGLSEFQPDFILPASDVAPDFVHSPMVMYLNSMRIKATDGRSLGEVYEPYFNRSYRHFCSHQHAPNKRESM